LVLTSHTWENAKNEHSHQDPSMAEAMLGELAPHSRVLFPADYNTAARVTQAVYESHGQIWTLVVPKSDSIPDLFTAAEASLLLQNGAARVRSSGTTEPRILITAVGAYQLEQAMKASLRLEERGVAHSLIYMLEPARFRAPRSEREAAHAAPEAVRRDLYPREVPERIFVTHTRPEVLLGTLQPLNTGEGTAGLGFINSGGTLDVGGMLFVNKCTWAHILLTACRLLGCEAQSVLDQNEIDALNGRQSPHGVII
jgi:phosphoketolase